MKQHGPARIVTVSLVDNTQLRVTPHHTVLSNRGWKRINALKRGDAIETASRGLLKVAAVTPVAIKEKVYNLITAGEHNFIAGGVVAHNFTVLRRLRTALHRVAEAVQARRPSPPIAKPVPTHLATR